MQFTLHGIDSRSLFTTMDARLSVFPFLRASEWLSTSIRSPNRFFKRYSMSALRRDCGFHARRVLQKTMEAVSLPVLYRYVWKELLPPLIVGVSSLSLLVLSVGTGPQILALLERLGFSLQSLRAATELAILRIPSCVGLALPIASLLASTFAIGGMGANQEITALNACGVTTLRATLPVILTYIIVTAVHFMISEGLGPYANQRTAITIDKTFLSASSNKPLAKQPKSKTFFRSDQPVIFPQFRESGLRIFFYGSGFDGSHVSDVIILETQDSSIKACSLGKSQLSCHPALKLERVIVAESAHWDIKEMMWVLENGIEVALEHSLEEVIKNKGSSRNGDCFQALHGETFSRNISKYSIQRITRFNNKFLPSLSCTLLDILRIGHSKRFEEMTIYEALKMEKLLKLSWNVKESRRLKVKIHQRIALPFACIIFGTIGALTSFHLPSEQRKRGFAISLTIVFCYYIISVTGAVLSQVQFLELEDFSAKKFIMFIGKAIMLIFTQNNMTVILHDTFIAAGSSQPIFRGLDAQSRGYYCALDFPHPDCIARFQFGNKETSCVFEVVLKQIGLKIRDSAESFYMMLESCNVCTIVRDEVYENEHFCGMLVCSCSPNSLVVSEQGQPS